MVRIGKSAIDPERIRSITPRGTAMDVHFKGHRGEHLTFTDRADVDAIKKLIKMLREPSSS
jgi:hypothetical protein